MSPLDFGEFSETSPTSNRPKKEITVQKRHLDAIFRSVNEGIITVDPEKRIIEINQAARKICGLTSN